MNEASPPAARAYGKSLAQKPSTYTSRSSPDPLGRNSPEGSTPKPKRTSRADRQSPTLAKTDPLVKAASNGHLAELASLLERDWPAAATLDEALCRACLNSDLQAVKLLLLHGAAVQPTQPQVQVLTEPPLFSACESGDPATIRELVRRGARLNFTTADGETPLGRAAFFGNLAAVTLLVESRASLLATHRSGNLGRFTPLDRAIAGRAELSGSGLPGDWSECIRLLDEAEVLSRRGDRCGKALSQFFWQMVRDTVRVRPYAMHWLAQCAGRHTIETGGGDQNEQASEDSAKPRVRFEDAAGADELAAPPTGDEPPEAQPLDPSRELQEPSQERSDLEQGIESEEAKLNVEDVEQELEDLDALELSMNEVVEKAVAAAAAAAVGEGGMRNLSAPLSVVTEEEEEEEATFTKGHAGEESPGGNDPIASSSEYSSGDDEDGDLRPDPATLTPPSTPPGLPRLNTHLATQAAQAAVAAEEAAEAAALEEAEALEHAGGWAEEEEEEGEEEAEGEEMEPDDGLAMDALSAVEMASVTPEQLGEMLLRKQAEMHAREDEDEDDIASSGRSSASGIE